MELRNILSIATTLIFIIVFTFSKTKRRTFVLFILFAFPFLDLNITPDNLGGLKVFHLISFSSLFFVLPRFRFNRNEGNIYTVLFWIFSLILLLGALMSEFVLDSLLALIKFFSVFIYAKLLIDECANDSAFSKKVINILCLMLLFSLIFLGIQMVKGLTFSFYGDLSLINVNNNLGGVVRYPSYFPEPQTFAQFLTMVSFLMLIRIKEKYKPVILNYIVFAAAILGLFIAGGRASFVGLFIGLMFLLLMGNQKVRLIGIGSIIIGAIAVFIYSDNLTIFNRNDTVEQSMDFRLTKWNEALDMFAENPILGIGIDNYQNYVSRYVQNQYWVTNDNIVYYSHPESGYLKVLVEFGAVGFFISLLFIVFPIMFGIKRYRNGTSDFNSILLIGAVISWSVSFITVYIFADLRILILFSTIICLLIVLKDSTKNEKIE